jgi:hypothetical protein
MEQVIGRSKPVSFVEQRRRSIVVDYLLAASTHGLRTIGLAHSTRNRIFWVVVFLTALSSMLYFVVSSVLQYLAYPTTTSIEIEAQRDMNFPAVTVCSANPYRADRMNVSLLAYAQRIGSNLTGVALENLATAMIVDLFNRNETDELNTIGFQLSDMLLACSYNNIDCSSNFTYSISSVFGNCYTFNWKAIMDKVLRLNDFGSGVIFFEGLSMTFYMPRELDFPLFSYDDGLVLLLHDNDELPLTAQKGIRLQPGLAHTIAYTKSQTTFLPQPYTNCTSSIEADLADLYKTTFGAKAASMVAYSETVCQELCEQAFVFSRCSCILTIPFFTRHVLSLEHDHLLSANCCTPFSSETQCAAMALQQLLVNPALFTTWCAHCAPQCVHTNFPSDLSALFGPTQIQKDVWASVLLSNLSNSTSVALPSDFAANYNAYMDANYLKVQVTCASQYVTIYKQEAKLSIIDTFSAVGGQTGL